MANNRLQNGQVNPANGHLQVATIHHLFSANHPEHFECPHAMQVMHPSIARI
jgi:hypothetical protein